MEQNLATLYLNQPSLEYRIALNQATVDLDDEQVPVLAVISSSFYGIELLRRCRCPLNLIGGGEFDLQGWLVHAGNWGWGVIEAADLTTPLQYANLVWAEPEKSSAIEMASVLRQRAMPGATLNVILSTGLRQILPDWQNGEKPAQDPIPIRQLLHLLQDTGWQIDHVSGYFGYEALVWKELARLSQAFGRAEWADRAEFAMRVHYVEKGWLWKLTPVVRICSRIP